MTRSPHILIVDDDREIRRLLERFLSENGFRVTLAAEGKAMKRALAVGKFDLIVLDVMLPGEDGLTLCRRLRAESDTPIIMLTAAANDTDRIVGLEMGADDYLAKPFNPRELLARARAVLRRTGRAGAQPREAGKTVYEFNGWRLDVAKRELSSPDAVRVELSSGEFDLLVALVERPQMVLAREQLLDIVRGRAAVAFDRSIDVQVSRLRRKIEANPAEPTLIKTVRGGGYTLAAHVAMVTVEDGAA